MDEAAQQQSKILADLQNEVVDLRKRLEPSAPASRDAPPMNGAAKPSPVQSILWVDDNPKNNSYEIDILQKQGITVVPAKSTAEAISLFSSRKFDRVISDMGCKEDNVYHPNAGIELVKSLRRVDSAVPIILYSNSFNVRDKREAALAAGITAAVSSATGLLEALNLGPSVADS